MLVVGLGVTGEAVVRHALRAGHDVTVIEDRPGGVPAPKGVTLVEAPDEERAGALARAADVVVPSPGVPERHAALRAAAAAGIPVHSEVEVAGLEASCPIVAITGTNGKTTVTTLATAMLERSGRRAVAAGNIGRPLLDAVHDDADLIVAEVSSFQLRFTESFRPRVAVLLNVAEDHLDWHADFDAYARAKARLFANQRDGDLLVFGADDPVAARLAAGGPARRVGFRAVPGRPGVAFDGDPLGATAHAALDVVPGFPERRPVDRANAAAAAVAALDVGGTPEGVRSALEAFRGLPHRLQLVGEVAGVRYFDDSKATNPHATRCAVEGFERVVLLAGGRNKGLDLAALRPIASRLRAVVALGEAAPDVRRAFEGVVRTVTAGSMREAVRLAAERARPGDVVLLSPACASFDWYRDYGARGDDFASEVAQLPLAATTTGRDRHGD